MDEYKVKQIMKESIKGDLFNRIKLMQKSNVDETDMIGAGWNAAINEILNMLKEY